jgi:hypothetical protein
MEILSSLYNLKDLMNYNKPVPGSDDFLYSTLEDAGIVTVQIFSSKIARILTKAKP